MLRRKKNTTNKDQGKMRFNANNPGQPWNEAVELSIPPEFPESWNQGDGSNAIILPGKRKDKSKIKHSKKEPSTLSKSKQRKLKQLEAEKQQKILQEKSIKILEEHKISDSVYSLLQSSGTIGRVETFKERRFRAVQLMKVGLEVPEDVFALNGKDNQTDTHKTEAYLEDSSVQDLLDHACVDSLMPPTNCGEEIDKTSKMALDVDSLSAEVGEKNASSCMIVDQHHSSIISCSCEGHDKITEDNITDGSVEKCEETKDITDSTGRKDANPSTVVHVSRPEVVEEQRKDLPIIMMEQEIMEAINENFVVILCGETGCGKTTQVPQFLYEAGYGSSIRGDRNGLIGVTQPRRVAVLATAKRVSFELGLSLGKEIGFQVRHDKMIGKSCSIKFMTDGILLREIQSDFLLKRYSIIILDEAHERSLNTDILIGMLSRIIKLRQKLYADQQRKILSGATISPENMVTELRLVLMSATLQVEDFIANKKLFDQSPPIIQVPVRQFPVTIHFSKRTSEDYLGQAYKKVIAIHKKLPSGGILVFVTGQREVEFVCKKLRKASQQLTRSSKQVDNESTENSEVNMKEIDEAFEVENDLTEQNDRVSSYEDEADFVYSEATDSETESDLEYEREDEGIAKLAEPKNSGSMLGFLEKVGNLSSLKSSFDALSGNSCEPNCGAESCPPTFDLGKPVESVHPPVSPLYVLPLYAMLPASSQLRVFEDVPEGERLVVVATNVAETSLTIPGIKYVIDTGKEKIKNYNHSNGMATYEVSWISKASAAQRAGRAGRTAPGHCYRLYSSAAFSKDEIFPKFSCPEISKVPVDGVTLLMKSLGIDKVENFPFPTRPDGEALLDAERCLRALEALDVQGRLTPMGRAMIQYPISPRHSRMLLIVIKILRNQRAYDRANLVLGYAVAAAAALSFPNPLVTQFTENQSTNGDTDAEKDKEEKLRKKKFKKMAREARARLSNPSSDALTIAYALQLFEISENPVIFCRDNLLHMKTMEEMSKLRKQLLELLFHQSKFCEEFSWNHGSLEDVECSWRMHSHKNPLQMMEEELISQSILAGWADRVAKRIRTIKQSSEDDTMIRAIKYLSCNMKDVVYLNRWSSVAQAAPEFLVYTELLQMKRPYLYGATTVKSDWLVKYASSLCTFSAPLTDPKPYYEPLSDQVLCWVTPTFGTHNWELPLHSIPIKNITLRLSVFASALLEGNVLPCLRSVQKFLASPPSSMLSPEALGQRRVGDLLNRLKIGSKVIDTRAKLQDAWSENPHFLYSEIKQWYQKMFHDHFDRLWERMHIEVNLEGYELFPKRAKKDKKNK
ncbi:ATP-dependent RNA helicase DEAH13 isoform X2 [Curcuma longa]|uniref:ATP-dependent RNA helicase DEAH13 isoform X2 n=1 Tax=Curcuma longa TaxID=136217 RepID=UPI003D9E2661